MKTLKLVDLIDWALGDSNSSYLFKLFSLSVLYTISSQIVFNLPFGLVPISLQPLPLFVCALLFGRIALDAYMLYYFEGACGLAVFSNFHGGIAHITGPTGGYLIGFFFAMFFLI